MLMSTQARHLAGQRDRYSTVAIVLHWTIAAALTLQLALGWHLADLEGLGRSTLLQLHKSVGITILVLTLVRLGWRFGNPPPAPHSSLTALERRLSHWVHVGFYAALLALPLTGWAMVSTRLTGGMTLFAVIPWPQVPFLTALPGDVQDLLSDLFHKSHDVLVWIALALIALHVAGALKHHLISRDPTVARMAPGVAPGRVLDPRLLAIPAVVAALAALVYLPRLADRPSRPKVVQLAKADVYLDIVGPVLDRRCGFCHNDDDARGGLSLTSRAAILQGGRGGPAVVPGRPDRSELLRRAFLPVDNPKHMPKDGKPALTRDEIATISWWIAQGAPGGGRVGDLKPPPAAIVAMNGVLGSDSAGEDAEGPGAREAALPVVAPADKAALDKVVADGFIVRKAKATSNLLVADYIAPTPLTDAAVADLARLGPQLLELNLRHAGAIDVQVRAIVKASAHLDTLRLEDNPVTDAVAGDIAALKSLAYLNIDSTKITDTGFAVLAQIPSLRRLHLWASAVTPQAVARVRSARKDLVLDVGLTAKDVPPNTKVVEPANN
jgi:cytochrome b561